MEQQRQREVEFRKHLPNGIPLGSPCCERHRVLLADANSNNGTQPRKNARPDTASNTVGIKETITSGTALLPFCQSCAEVHLFLEPGQYIAPVDQCFCASRIMATACWFCEVEHKEALKQSYIQECTVGLPSSRAILTCGCGQEAGRPDLRLCAGCGGMVKATSKPLGGKFVPTFPNMAGMLVRFRPYAAKVMA